ncbi:hypothetical protein ECZU51_28530 [Escherichia coli]|nr:hypothetical protein ECZU51_28530 [Escherichia coli]
MLPPRRGGYVSSYLSELTRHLQRTDRLYPAATTGLFGGAVGNPPPSAAGEWRYVSN